MERVRCQGVRAAWANAAAKGFVRKPGVQLLRTHNRTQVLLSSLEVQHLWSKLLLPPSHTSSSPADAIRTFLQHPRDTQQSPERQKWSTFNRHFHLYSIKGEKKAAQFNNCRSVYSLPAPQRIRDFYLQLWSPDSMTPLSITGWIITAWNLPCHFPAPWRNSPCPHPSDNAHCQSRSDPQWPWTTANSAPTSWQKRSKNFKASFPSWGLLLAGQLLSGITEKCTLKMTGRVDASTRQSRQVHQATPDVPCCCCSLVSRKGASNWNGSS